MSVIGIDLGTANTMVAVLQQHQAYVLANEQGSRSTPSIVAFTDEERLIGDAALHQMAKNPENTVFEFKRLLGREYDELVGIKEKWPFPVKTSFRGATEIQIQYKHERRNFLPEEITGMILSRMKEIAETHTGSKIAGAVITVPASFSLSQRRATQQAAAIAEIPLLGLIDEPLAAAVAYGLNRNRTQRRNVLIFHLGAGTFEVMIVTMGFGVFDVKATAGSTTFGGEDLIEKLFHRFLKEMKDQYLTDIRYDPKAVTKLRLACKKSVKDLGLSPTASIKVDAIFQGNDFESSINRDDFIKINEENFKSMVRSVEEALKDAELGVEEINDVVAVGGSTRMPIIHDILAQRCGFGEGKIKKTLNVDEAAVEGATIMAGLLSGDQERIFAVNGMLAHSVKIEQDKNMIQLFPRNIRIPATATLRMNTVQKYPLTFKVYEDTVVVGSNQSCDVQRCMVASFSMDGLGRRFQERPIIEMTFQVDSDGILHVTGPDGVEFIQNMGLQSHDIKKSNLAIGGFRQEEEERKQVMADLHKFERKVYDLQTFLEGLGGKFGQLEYYAKQKCRELLTWIQEMPNPSRQEVKEKEKELYQLQQQLNSVQHRESPAHTLAIGGFRQEEEERKQVMADFHKFKRQVYDLQTFLQVPGVEFGKFEHYAKHKCRELLTWIQQTPNPSKQEVKEKEEEFYQLQQELNNVHHRESPAHDTGAKSRNNQKKQKAKQPSSTSAIRKEAQDLLDFFKKQDEKILKNKKSLCKKTEAVINWTETTTNPEPPDLVKYQGTMNSLRYAWDSFKSKVGMSASNARPPNSNPDCNASGTNPPWQIVATTSPLKRVQGHPATPRNDHQHRGKEMR